jgi:hypothetical protein
MSKIETAALNLATLKAGDTVCAPVSRWMTPRNCKVLAVNFAGASAELAHPETGIPFTRKFAALAVAMAVDPSAQLAQAKAKAREDRAKVQGERLKAAQAKAAERAKASAERLKLATEKAAERAKSAQARLATAQAKAAERAKAASERMAKAQKAAQDKAAAKAKAEAEKIKAAAKAAGK